MYLGCDDYIKNYISAEIKECYRLISFWHYWWCKGLLAAKSGDTRIVIDFGIIDSENF